MDKLELIEELHKEPISDVITRNQEFLGRPIVAEETLVTLLLKSGYFESVDDLDHLYGIFDDYLFSNDHGKFVDAEQKMRVCFRGGYAMGLPRFVVVHHPINCRDVFATSKEGKNYLFVGRFYVSENEKIIPGDS